MRKMSDPMSDYKKLHSQLTQLLPAQFEEVLVAIEFPSEYKRKEVAQTQQAIDVVQWVKKNPERLKALVDTLNRTLGIKKPLFSRNIKALFIIIVLVGLVAIFIEIFIWLTTPTPHLELSASDGMEEGVYIVHFKQPFKPYYKAALKNNTNTSISYHLSKFPRNTFETTLGDSQSLVPAHSAFSFMIAPNLQAVTPGKYLFSLKYQQQSLKMSLHVSKEFVKSIKILQQYVLQSLPPRPTPLESHQIMQDAVSIYYPAIPEEQREVLSAHLLESIDQPLAAAISYQHIAEADSQLAQLLVQDPPMMVAMAERYEQEDRLTHAAHWYEAASEKEDAEAQYRLGQFYMLGKGVEAQPDTARHWFERASAQGHAAARKRLEQPHKRLSPSLDEATTAPHEDKQTRPAESGTPHEAAVPKLKEQVPLSASSNTEVIEQTQADAKRPVLLSKPDVMTGKQGIEAIRPDVLSFLNNQENCKDCDLSGVTIRGVHIEEDSKLAAWADEMKGQLFIAQKEGKSYLAGRRHKEEIKTPFGVVVVVADYFLLVQTPATSLYPVYDFSAENLSGVSLSGVSLSGVSLSGADLRGADLIGANLSGASLSGANLREANLREANLREANLREANLREANLSGAYLSGANLIGATLSGADLSMANLSNADLSKATLILANLSGANLIKADLRGADLIGATLIGATLSGADLSGADLSGADLSGAIYSPSQLNHTLGKPITDSLSNTSK